MATVLRQRAAEPLSIPKRGRGELTAGVTCLALLAVIPLCTLCISLPAFAGTYYVSTAGSDTAPGTLDAPWRTIRTSVTRLQDGDVLIVQPGTYYEGNINTGIHATPITIQAAVPREAIIDGTGHNWFGIGVNDPNPPRYQGCRLIGLKIQNQKIGIGCQTTADDFYIENCEITGCTNSAIHCYSGSNWTVRNTYAHGNRNGIWFGVKGVSGVSGVLVEDCLCVDNTNPTDPNTDGVLVEELCGGTVVQRCTASGHGDQGFDIKPNAALVERCLSHGNMGGFKLWGEGIRLVNCMARNNAGTGLKLMGDRTELWNCTVAYNETGLRPQAPDNSTVVVRNTIVAFNMNKQYTTTLFDDDYNLYWVPAGQPMWRFFIGDEMHDYTVDDLAAGSLAIGPHTLLADPQFVNAAGGDLTPGAQSPAIAAGVWAEFLTEDLLGNPRRIGAPPDIGAVSTWTGPPAPSVNAVSPDTGVNAGPVQVTITGAGFRVGSTAKLTRAEHADITATGTVVDGPGQIHCTFDLSRAALGDWTVVVTNEDGQYGKLIDAFSVTGELHCPPKSGQWAGP
ncbi:MAG: right-handed parallel beta-helix repeat-containing protein [Acidobacteriota bacterium]|nr:right-handed parallel beta-helix repeat-containing protein [Acidobacteriota bacterium]